MTEEIIRDRISNKIQTGKKFFLVFASKMAMIKDTEMCIERKYNEDYLKIQGYSLSIEKLNNSAQERVWIFEKVYTGILDLVELYKIRGKREIYTRG